MTYINNERSVVPVVNWELSNLCTLLYELVLVIEELVEVVWVLWLTCNCCEGLVSNYRLLFGVLDALSNEMLVASASYLTENEADFMLK